MTMLVVVGRPYCGLVAADTRVVSEDGTYFDDVEVDAGNPLGGPAITIGTTFRKFGPLANGWVGMTGSATWGQLAIDAIQQHDVDEIEALAHCVQHNVTIPAVKKLDVWPMFRLAPVLRTANGYTSYFVKPDGITAMNVGVMVTSPPGMDSETADRLTARIEAEFLPDGYANGLSQALRTVAEVIGEGHQHGGPDGPMSDKVEIGLSQPGWPSQHLPPTPFQTLVNATDKQCSEMLMSLNRATRRDAIVRIPVGSGVAA